MRDKGLNSHVKTILTLLAIVAFIVLALFSHLIAFCLIVGSFGTFAVVKIYLMIYDYWENYF